MGLLKAMAALQSEAQKPRTPAPDGNIRLVVTRQEYNYIAESLARLARSKSCKLNALPIGDYRRKSYGYALNNTNLLLDKLRKQLKGQI